MSLLEKVKKLFVKDELPEETRAILHDAGSVNELMTKLDLMITRNEVEKKELDREIDKLGSLEDKEKERVKNGSLNERQKRAALRTIKNLRSQMDSYERRNRIYQDNIDLHMALLNRVCEMQAMEHKAVTAGQIDEVSLKYQEEIERHREVVAAGKVAAELEADLRDVSEEAELDRIERELLVEKAAQQQQQAEKDATERAEKERAERAAAEKEPEGEAKARARISIEKVLAGEVDTSGETAEPAEEETAGETDDEEGREAMLE